MPDDIPVPLGKTRPPGWFFTGWFPFCLYGPFVQAKLRITTLEKAGNIQDSMKVNGRAVKRENVKKESDISRNNNDKNDRGVSMSMKLGFASLDQKSKDHNLKSNVFIQQKKEGNMMTINCAITVNQRNIDRAEVRALRHCPEYNATNSLWITVTELENKSKFLESQLQALIDIQSTEKSSVGVIDDVLVEGGTNLLNKYVEFDCTTPKRAKIMYLETSGNTRITFSGSTGIK
jgi:hypothetical protein